MVLPAPTTLSDVSLMAGRRPISLLVAVAGSALTGTAIVAASAASLASGHGGFSAGVALALLVYGGLALAATWLLWRRSVLGRGPVLAISLLNLMVAFTYTADATWAWAVVAVCAATVVATAWPSTSRDLRLRRDRVSSADEPPRSDGQGK